jgi:hypothetical protein
MAIRRLATRRWYRRFLDAAAFHFNIFTRARDCAHCVLLVMRQLETQAPPKSVMVFGPPEVVEFEFLCVLCGIPL